MDPRFLLRVVLLTFTLILLAPMVFGCVDFFTAQGQTNFVQSSWLDGKLWDGGSGGFSVTCSLSGYPDSNGNYDFSCISGYGASLIDQNPNAADGYIVQYTTPHGSYTFAPDYFPCGDGSSVFCDTWKACEYGCGGSDCFVYNCGLDYSDCAPPS